MRRSLVGLVLALAVLGAGCSSEQPNAATVAAQKQVQVSQAAVRADLKTLETECPHTPIACVTDAAVAKKLTIAEAHFTQAVAALKRADPGLPVPSPPGGTKGSHSFYFPSTS
jgi:hypothetical protein